MKKILILITVFMSPLTFAQLDGKGLICIPAFDPPNLLTPEAFLFEEDKFYEYDLRTTKDQVQVTIITYEYTFSSDSDFIYWTLDVHRSGLTSMAIYKLNRRTLNLDREGLTIDIDSVNFQCEIFEDKENFDIGISAMREKAQAQYDESLEGNKI